MWWVLAMFLIVGTLVSVGLVLWPRIRARRELKRIDKPLDEFADLAQRWVESSDDK